MGDLNSRRGRIVPVNPTDHAEQIKAVVPLAELLTYAPVLHALTGGRGTYVMEFAQYEEVPRDVASRIVEHHKADRQAVVH